jgi:hypothetical protein
MKTVFRLFALISAAALIACGERSTAVTLNSICKQENGTIVTAEGYLSPPTPALRCTNGQCWIDLKNETEHVLVGFSTSPDAEPGKMIVPPAQSTFNALQVMLADGSIANQQTRVTITGPVRISPKSCYLEAYTTERH